MKHSIRAATIAALSALAVIAADASAAVTVRYYNKDSKPHQFEAMCRGSKYSVSFSASTTSSTTIQGGSPCVLKTPGGPVTLNGGEKIEIKDGRIKIE
jgi:hypothetical protein